LEILHNITEKDIYIVNESGASVYSASKIAQEEFPELDSLDR
jgi:transcriptional accessory protein Tex/SPT6